MTWKHCFFRGTVVLLAAIVVPRPAFAEQPQWLTGEPLRQALTHKAGVTWSNVPVRQSLARFCQSQKLAFVLDRRIDPDRKVELSFDNVPLDEALRRIASRLDVGVAMVGPVAYFGPKSTAEIIRTVAALRSQDAAGLAPAVRASWLRPKTLNWQDAASPRDLLAAIGRENKLEIEGLNDIPHDVWAAADLPPLGLPDRLTLILAQFDLTYESAADGRSIQLVPIPANAKIERSYTVAGSLQEVASRMRQNKLLSAAEITPSGNKLHVRARQEDHDLVKELLSGRPARRTTVQEGKQVYTLKVRLAADKLLEELAKRLDLEIQIDRDAIAAKGISLEKEVQIDVKQVSADELLRAVLDPVGLTFNRRDKVIEVIPKL